MVLILSQRGDSAFVDAFIGVGDNLLEINLVDITQSLALGTCSFGRVEREIVGCGFRIRDARNGIHQSFGVTFQFIVVLIQYHDNAVALLHCYLNGLFQAFVVLALNLQLVYHHFDIVVFIAVNLHAAGYLHYLAINAHVQVTLASHTLEQFSVVPFSLVNQWRQNVDALVGIAF